MNGIDQGFVANSAERLRALPPDRKPKWGKLTAPELVPHLIGAFKSSMGELPPTKFIGNWFTTTVLPPIVYTGWLMPPKNIKLLNEKGEAIPALSVPGSIEDLAAVMEEFIRGRDSGTLKTTAHPLFGDVGPEGWGKVHVVHMRHHFKQFGI